MEHRDADFNIMLATDSYKVTNRQWFYAECGCVEGNGGLMEIDEVKVVSSSAPRPSRCTALCHRSPSTHSRPNRREEEEERAGEAGPGYQMGERKEKNPEHPSLSVLVSQTLGRPHRLLLVTMVSC